MPLNWFQGKPGLSPPKVPVVVESVDREKLFGAAEYDADEALVDAVNTALLLDQPLLLSGEPGTGKTQLAEKLALELGLEPVFRHETKSTSVAQDLFYTFDHVARFQVAQGSQNKDDLNPLHFIDYGALGRAILQSLPEDKAKERIAGVELPTWFKGPRRAVVLIDEIDKAPSDFPNDALNEIERHYFRLREAGNVEISAAKGFKPIVIITSNAERQLPDAFLRRCIFHHLNPIDRKRLESIATRRLASLMVKSGPMLDDAMKLFFELRESPFDLRKRPSTAEFLAFVAALIGDERVKVDAPLPAAAARQVLSTLIKSPEDQVAAKTHPLLADTAKVD
jgi:MoxR-like ATPase